MSPFALEAFVASLPWAALGVVLVLAVTYAAAISAGAAGAGVAAGADSTVAEGQARHSVMDVAWGPGFVVIALISFVLSAAEGDSGRRVLLLILTGIWGIRLGIHIGRRARGGHEDPRYVALLKGARGSRNAYALRRVYLPQGLVMFFVSLTIQVGMFATDPLGLLAVAGSAVWLTGFIFESVGDRQLEQFKNDPARRGTVLNTGLWRYTRHPNYFGDAAVWAGLFLIAAESWPGVLTILSPALMIWTLTAKTGKPLTEQAMSGRPGYRDYVQSTSGFIPWPPRRH